MQDWQQRVVDEKFALDLKIKGLNEFFYTTGFSSLEEFNQDLLNEQWATMCEYSNILNTRILNFRD